MDKVTNRRGADLKARTKAFAVRIIHLVDALPNRRSANEIGRQLLRSGMSVGANYRAACRGRSRKEFIAKLGIVEEECDESLYWMEVLVEAGVVQQKRLAPLMKETGELLAIVISSIKTTARNKPVKA
ncbi:MAG: four helix bundle protein [Planctomycetota bacterium]|nr:four helix bundle protein [Planctomycetota bacterium]